MAKLISQPSGQQSRPDGSQPREKLEGSTKRHTYNVNPPSAQSAGGGKISPNSHNRGPQG